MSRLYVGTFSFNYFRCVSSRLHIKEFLQLAKGALILDVRSPGEFEQGHIPGAISFPLFSDEERKVVGTTYKQKSREDAIKVGLDYFALKMRPMVEDVENRLGAKTGKVFIYCWRGGMRSGAVAWLLQLYGFEVMVLSGGYKTFRRFILESFTQPWNLKILGGYTGSGKTLKLQSLNPHIDLEDLASHRGSAFGKVKKSQGTQEQFENNLGVELQAKSGEEFIWLEDESQRIGQLFLPIDFFRQMQAAPLYFMEVPFEERLVYLVQEYGSLDTDYLQSGIERIRKRLGPLAVKQSLSLLEEGKIKDLFSILLLYYDKHYLKGLQEREARKVPVTFVDKSFLPEKIQMLTNT